MIPLDSPQEESGERIALGRLVRVWGLEGALVVEPWTDSPGRFERLDELWLAHPTGTRRVRIVRTRAYGNRVLVWLDLAGDCTAAQALVGSTLEVDAAEAEPPAEGAFYTHDLIGLEVLDVKGLSVGRVRDVLDAGNGGVLEVELTNGDEAFIPALGGIVTEVRLADGQLIIDPPEGLIDVNRKGPSS